MDVVELLGLSRSIVLEVISALPLLLCLRCLFDDVAVFLMDDAPGPGAVFGGAAAMGTTPLPPMAAADDPVLPKWLFGVLPAVLPPEPGPTLAGLSTSFEPTARVAEGGVAAC